MKTRKNKIKASQPVLSENCHWQPTPRSFFFFKRSHFGSTMEELSFLQQSAGYQLCPDELIDSGTISSTWKLLSRSTDLQEEEHERDTLPIDVEGLSSSDTTHLQL